MHASIPNHVDIHDDASIVELVRANPDWRLELSSDGRILVSPLTGTKSGQRELAAALQLVAWARLAGGKAFGASAGFRLPDGSLVGPDAAWISVERLAALDPDALRSTFWRVCPDVAIEVMSEWDTWGPLVEKIDRYRTNGADYAVAIDVERRRTYERGDPPAGLLLDFDRIIDA